MGRPPIERGFQTPVEIIAYFAEKNLAPAFSWQDVWGEEHAFAFTVAKALDRELLELFKTSIEEAIDQGLTFEAWRDGIRDQMASKGWWGPRTVSDPTGVDPDRVVDFSKSRRLQTVYWSNMRSARAAGQWDRMQRTKSALPYILYVRTSAADPRQEHLSFVGTILSVDHPFWDTHFPPNGWGCKCSVRQITRREAERLLGSDPNETGTSYSNEPVDLGTKQFFNKRTGETVTVPVGIDPGWANNPGKDRARILNEL